MINKTLEDNKKNLFDLMVNHKYSKLNIKQARSRIEEIDLIVNDARDKEEKQCSKFISVLLSLLIAVSVFSFFVYGFTVACIAFVVCFCAVCVLIYNRDGSAIYIGLAEVKEEKRNLLHYISIVEQYNKIADTEYAFNQECI